MKPIKLYIAGIKSFTDAQEIDFAALSQNKLFGIFGNTGSGKSTILAGMIIALYGDEGKATSQRDFINLTLNQAQVKYEFELTQLGETAVYTVDRTFKVRPSGTADNKAKLCKRAGEQELVLEDTISGVNKRIEQLVGLSLAEFKKCVVLPQGEFASFLQSGRGDRLQIIGKLFDLEQYGDALLSKVSERKAEKEKGLEAVKAHMSAQGEFCPADIQTLQEKLKTQAQELAASRAQRDTLKEQLSAHSEDIRNKAALAKQEENLAALKKAAPEMERQSKSLEQSAKAQLIKPQIDSLKALTATAKLNLKIFQEETKKTQRLETQCADAQRRYLESDAFYKAEGEQLKSKIASLTALKPRMSELGQKQADIKKLSGEYKKNIGETANLSEIMEKAETRSKKLSERLSTLERQIDKDDLAADSLKRQYFLRGSVSEAQYAAGYLAGSGYSAHFEDRAKVQESSLTEELKSGALMLTQEERKKLKEEINLLTGEIKQADGDISQKKERRATLSAQAQAISEKGKILKGEIEQIKQSFLEYGIRAESEDELAADIAALQKRHDKALAALNADREAYETISAETNRTKANCLSLQTLYEENNKSLLAQEKVCNELVLKHGFKDKEEAAGALISKAQEDIIRAALEKHTHNLSVAEGDIARLSGLIQGKTVDAEKYKTDSQKLEQLEKAVTQLNVSIALNKEDLKRLKEKKEKVAGLKKQEEQLTVELDRAALLHKLVSGKKFMEYVAEEFIQDITQSATQHINHLSGGRYTLHYDKEGFLVADNYSGGQQRKVSTLSGGETFLVSLSLAVSLSESIVKSSDKSIEFFFLDEGFGTLDKELCDTVIEALERLRQSRFTIGLISHVPELMQRLDYKLQVSPPTENKGSTIRHVLG